MRRKLLELLGFPLERIESELKRSLEEIDELQSWAKDAKNRLEKLANCLDEL